MPFHCVDLLRIAISLSLQGLSRKKEVQHRIGHSVKEVFVGLGAEELESANSDAHLLQNFSMYGRFGTLTDINESAGRSQESGSRIFGTPDQQDAPIVSLDEYGDGHRGIEEQAETAGGADHRCPEGRRGDGFSAARAMVELSGGMHDARPTGRPFPFTVFLE
jgi:hypothetical protein